MPSVVPQNVLSQCKLILVLESHVNLAENEVQALQKESSQVTRCLLSAPPKGSTFDGILSISSTPHSEDIFSLIFTMLQPGGKLILKEPSSDKDLFLPLTFAGFVDIQKQIGNNQLEIVSSKPNWTQGASQSLKKQKKPVVWALAKEEELGELEDEDSLLMDEDFNVPTKKRDDCEVTSTRKACKNCVCGRKEQEEAIEKKIVIPIVQPKSACGSCSLGDAFRCATCPYLGQPAFKPGEKVELSLDSDDI